MPPDEVIEETIENAEEESNQETAKPDSEEKTSSNNKKEEADDDVDVDKAKELYRALNNPKTAHAVIEMLAKEAGLLKGKEELTPKEEKVVKKALRDIVKEKLGDDLGFMGDKLADVIEAVLEEHGKDTQAKFAKIEAEKAQNEVSRAVENIYSKYEDAPKYEKRMLELMDEFTPGKGVNMNAYMDKIYKLAKSEATEAGAKKKMQDKLKNNSDDATARLSSSSTRDVPAGTKSSKALNIEDAFDKAVKDLNLG